MKIEARMRILCVDDDAALLEGLASNLRRSYEVVTAPNGAAGLALLNEADPFAVVLSDMRMPGMDGAAFLAQVRQRAPDTVRMLLTGQTDLQAAIAAVNEGQIFRFLTKPCPVRMLLGAFATAAEQHRLITTERVLLEQTLRGCVATLLDVLVLANPVAFGRAVRIRQHVLDMATKLQIAEGWKVEVAAILSQVGCACLPADTAERVYEGCALDHSEQGMVARLPRHAQRLIARIPRLEEVGQIVACQQLRFDGGQENSDLPRGAAIPLGARIIKIVHDYDVLLGPSMRSAEALAVLETREGWYDRELLATFSVLRRSRESGQRSVHVKLSELHPGQLLAEDLRLMDGTLLATRGAEVTAGLLERLRNHPLGARPEQALVFTLQARPPAWAATRL